MLVLTRRAQETIQIGDDIQIKVLVINQSRVRIGIDAPSHVRIMRTELLEPAPSSDDTATLPLAA